MSEFKPDKLFVEFNNGISLTAPVTPRLYTLTHSDTAGELFLSIGKHYAWDKINPMRNEVLAEWRVNGDHLHYCVYLYIDQGEHDLHVSEKRNEIFRRELPLALTAIRYGDRLLFNAHPKLDYAPIIINFMSTYPQLSRQENWGTFYSYT
ncbi:staygreen family protein [Virgibacillus kekensis]|uniref:Staygreen family protein n=1 Tax=Virgibacillus kekensis TaxID=202261 RepID=A0ABV9DJ59_9BACI